MRSKYIPSVGLLKSQLIAENTILSFASILELENMGIKVNECGLSSISMQMSYIIYSFSSLLINASRRFEIIFVILTWTVIIR